MTTAAVESRSVRTDVRSPGGIGSTLVRKIGSMPVGKEAGKWVGKEAGE